MVTIETCSTPIMRGVNAVAPNPAEAANTARDVVTQQVTPPGCRAEKSEGHKNKGYKCVDLCA